MKIQTQSNWSPIINNDQREREKLEKKKEKFDLSEALKRFL